LIAALPAARDVDANGVVGGPEPDEDQVEQVEGQG
jgi:hypothetical protein